MVTRSPQATGNTDPVVPVGRAGESVVLVREGEAFAEALLGGLGLGLGSALLRGSEGFEWESSASSPFLGNGSKNPITKET